ncbi:hypothetical protein GBF38_015722 [Nibea albiflora]|uniref:Uncharacterized protein n=1 Tax=Nibea albiflora TaxID=240163 RepID=A0ACB7FHH0_NIBAL|nr:hypothetical protein GBF38_015722 [Nibea albiflora]
MINYVVGVEWNDKLRFKLTDNAHSQTSEVTVYKLNHQDGFKIDHSLTIVDTPGFGGRERDEEIAEQLRNVFCARHGLREIDAVCFVAQAALARLTPTQKYVFDSVLSIFGKDVAENIRVLVTFADGRRPPVLEAINAAGVPCPKSKDGLPVHFKFNNSALFADNRSSAAGSKSEDDDDDEGFDQMFWNMGTKSMKKFFNAFTEKKPMTMEVLRDRHDLEGHYEHLLKELFLFDYKSYPENTLLPAIENESLMANDEHLYYLVETIKICTDYLTSLKKKTLKTNLLSTSEYTDFLIQREQSEAKSGWKQRVEFLMNMRDGDNNDEDEDSDDLIYKRKKTVKMTVKMMTSYWDKMSSCREIHYYNKDDDAALLLKKMLIKTLLR